MLLWYPLSFQTPGWSIWPSFWISCCTRRDTQTTGTHTMRRQPRSHRAHAPERYSDTGLVSELTEHVWRKASEEVKRGRRRVWDREGRVGSIIMCHSRWSRAKSHTVNNLWCVCFGFFLGGGWAGCRSIKNIMPNMSLCRNIDSPAAG